jgi:hypothetical protein
MTVPPESRAPRGLSSRTVGASQALAVGTEGEPGWTIEEHSTYLFSVSTYRLAVEVGLQPSHLR